MKSNPTPERGTVAFAARALDATVSVPDWPPKIVGANVMPTVQLAAAASEVPQVVPASWNPAEGVKARFPSGTDALKFVNVTVRGLLVIPRPVVGKFAWAGSIWSAPVNPPVPFNATVAGAATDVELTVSDPVNGPVCNGANKTATVQLAPAARLVPQVLAVRSNCPVTASANAAAAVPPGLEIITVCAGLICAMAVAAKVSCAGDTLSWAAGGTVPLSRTVAVPATEVELKISVPVKALVRVGAKAIPTVQLAPEASVIPHVFPDKLNGPDTVRVSATAAVAPELATVTIWGALV